MKQYGKSLACVFLGLIFVSSCGRKSEAPRSETKSNFDFVTDLSANEIIGIKRTNLGKEYLLRTNLLSGASAVRFDALKTRIVTFQQVGNRLILIESSSGLQFHSELPQTLILASFPILSEDSDLIRFDFNEGMNRLYTGMKDWHVHNKGDSTSDVIANRFEGHLLESSFIEEADISEKGLYIQQAAKAIADKTGHPVEIRYNIKPYIPSRTFHSKSVSQHQDDFGYFAIHPQVKEDKQTVVTQISKFDISKPIVFFMSANTPTEFRDVIREGVLYWNKAFGKDILKVEIAPEGVNAPDYQRNMIQWVDWKTAESAYADAHMDPRSGEILNAQIFLPSSFAVSGTENAEKFIRKVQASSLSSLNTHSSSNKDALTNNAHLCAHEAMESFANGLEHLLLKDAPEELVARFTKDYLRGIVAHEVGHTLGLRHNFAGSQEANYANEDWDKIFESYTDKQVSETLVISSSIMDYLPFQASVISGWQLAHQSKAFPYDEQAIRSLYLDQQYKTADVPLFCTDGDVKTYVDCSQFLVGKNPFANAYWKTKDAIDDLPSLLANFWITKLKDKETEQNWNPLVYNLDAEALAVRFLKNRTAALESLQEGKHSFVRSKKEKILGIHGKSFAELALSEIQRLGGLEKIFFHLNDSFVTDQMAEFRKVLLKRMAYSTEKFTFTNRDLSTIDSWIKTFLEKFYWHWNELELLQLSVVTSFNATPTQSGSIAESMAPFYVANARRVLDSHVGFDTIRGRHELKLTLAETIDPKPFYELAFTYGIGQDDLTLDKTTALAGAIVQGMMDKAPLFFGTAPTLVSIFAPIDFKLRKFRYSDHMRGLALNLLTASPQILAATYDERLALAEDLKKEWERDLFHLDIEGVKTDHQPKTFVHWVKMNRKILGMLRTDKF